MNDYHYWLYSDLTRVKEARVQAKGRIAERNLRAMVMEGPKVVVDWLTRRLS